MISGGGTSEIFHLDSVAGIGSSRARWRNFSPPPPISAPPPSFHSLLFLPAVAPGKVEEEEKVKLEQHSRG